MPLAPSQDSSDLCTMTCWNILYMLWASTGLPFTKKLQPRDPSPTQDFICQRLRFYCQYPWVGTPPDSQSFFPTGGFVYIHSGISSSWFSEKWDVSKLPFKCKYPLNYEVAPLPVIFKGHIKLHLSYIPPVTHLCVGHFPMSFQFITRGPPGMIIREIFFVCVCIYSQPKDPLLQRSKRIFCASDISSGWVKKKRDVPQTSGKKVDETDDFWF